MEDVHEGAPMVVEVPPRVEKRPGRRPRRGTNGRRSLSEGQETACKTPWRGPEGLGPIPNVNPTFALKFQTAWTNQKLQNSLFHDSFGFGARVKENSPRRGPRNQVLFDLFMPQGMLLKRLRKPDLLSFKKGGRRMWRKPSESTVQA